MATTTRAAPRRFLLCAAVLLAFSFHQSFSLGTVTDDDAPRRRALLSKHPNASSSGSSSGSSGSSKSKKGSGHAVEYVIVGSAGFSAGALVMELNTHTGDLTPLGNGSALDAAGNAPMFFAWAPDQRGQVSYLFAIDAAHQGDNKGPGTGLTVAHWAMGDDGQPALGSSLPGGGVNFVEVPQPSHVAVSPSGRHALTASYRTNTVAVTRFDGATAGGAGLGEPLVLTQESVGVQPHETVLDPTAKFAYVPCLGSDWVRVYAFDDDAGTLAPLCGAGDGGAAEAADPATCGIVRAPKGCGPRHLALLEGRGALGGVAYLVCQDSSEVVAFDWDRESGALRRVSDGVTGNGGGFKAGDEGDAAVAASYAKNPGRVVSTVPPPAAAACGPGSDPGCAPPTQAAAEIQLSPNDGGRFVYVSNRGGNGGSNSVAVLEAIPGHPDGFLRAVGFEDAGGQISGPRHMSLAGRDGRWVLVGNMGNGTVSVLSRDPETGRLAHVRTVALPQPKLEQPAYVSVVPRPPPVFPPAMRRQRLR